MKDEDEALRKELLGDPDMWDRDQLIQRVVELTHNYNVAKKPELAREQMCGCVICICENNTQCQGCGAKHCGTHPVGEIPNPVYKKHPLQDAARKSRRNWIKYSNDVCDLEEQIHYLKKEIKSLNAKINFLENIK